MSDFDYASGVWSAQVQRAKEVERRAKELEDENSRLRNEVYSPIGIPWRQIVGDQSKIIQESSRGEWGERKGLLELCAMYDQQIERWWMVGPQKADASRGNLTSAERLSHLRWMLGCIPTLSDDGKINRWLGFVQGVMFAMQMYTIDTLRAHITEAKK